MITENILVMQNKTLEDKKVMDHAIAYCVFNVFSYATLSVGIVLSIIPIGVMLNESIEGDGFVLLLFTFPSAVMFLVSWMIRSSVLPVLT